METTKATRWAFTAYEQQWHLFQNRPPIIAEWGWQEEVCPDTGRHHYQGYIRTDRQVRMSQLIKLLPGVHLEIARNWQATVQYCKKSETAIDGTRHHETNGIASLSMAQALIRVARARPRDINLDFDTLEDYKKAYALEYDRATTTLLREDRNLVGLYSQPQYERAYIKWRKVWVEFAEAEQDEKTDRQTDNSPEPEVEEDTPAEKGLRLLPE